MTVNKEAQDRLVEGLRSTVAEVLHTMAWSEVTFLGSQEIKDFTVTEQTVGIVRLYGKMRGMVSVSTDTVLAKEVVARIAGISADEVTNEDLIDGIAELANMICGGMKSKAALGDIELSTPIAIIGQGLIANWKTDRNTLQLNFQVEGHALRVLACV